MAKNAQQGGGTTAGYFDYDKPATPEVEKKLNARIKRFRDAQRWIKPDKTPVMAHTISWQFIDAGYTFAQATRDYDLIEKAMIRMEETYNFDHINCINSGFRNTFLINDSLGGGKKTNEQSSDEKGATLIHTDGESGTLNAVFEGFIQPEDYKGIVENYNKTIWEKVLFRRFPAAKNYTAQQFAQAAKTMLDFSVAREKLDKKLRYIYADPMEMHVLHYGSYIDDLFNTLIGIKGVSVALRRNKEALKELCDAMDAARFAGFKAMAEAGGPVDECYDFTSGLLSSTIMSHKQFEEFHGSSLGNFLRYAQENDKQTYFWTEGSFDHVADFFNDFKKGTVTFMIELDDPYMIRKKYPNICLQGGLISDHLGAGTVQQNIDDAKRAIDELGHSGGLVLAGNKMITYARDLKGENLKAVCDFVASYK